MPKRKTTMGKARKGGARGRPRRAHAAMKMAGAMTIYQAGAQKEILLSALGKAQDLEIDLSRVTEMDSAGIQLLLLLKREATAVGKAVRLTAHSPATLAVLDLYNLGGYFGDPVLLSSRER